MRHAIFCFLVCLFTILGQSRQALADPLILNLVGTAYGVPINKSIDVTNGFSGLSLPVSTVPVGSIAGFQEPAVGSSTTLNSFFNLSASLSDGSNLLASGALSGSILVNLTRPSFATDLNGSVSGTASLSNLYIPQGVNPMSVPGSFSGLSASVSGYTTGGSLNLLQTNLAIIPGASVSVPEPSTLSALLVGLGGLAFWKRRFPRDANGFQQVAPKANFP